jgi:hypothetical protein
MYVYLQKNGIDERTRAHGPSNPETIINIILNKRTHKQEKATNDNGSNVDVYTYLVGDRFSNSQALEYGMCFGCVSSLVSVGRSFVACHVVRGVVG